MKSPWLEIFLWSMMIGASFLIYFALKWFFEDKRWFKTKTFAVRFLIAPFLFLWAFQANFNNQDAVKLLIFLFAFGAIDRLAAWFDRKVPDSNPNKYR